MKTKLNICPVCGYDKLLEPPYDDAGHPSHEICPCCNFEYGFDDASEGFTFDAYRMEWICDGFKFNSEKDKPDNWNKDALSRQLENIKKVNFKPRI